MLHAIVDVPEHDQPAGGVRETNDVPTGIVSDSVTEAASLGPGFVTVIVYVMLPPAATGSGESLFAIDRSAETTTCVLADAEVVALRPFALVLNVTTFVIVPAGVDGLTFTTSVNCTCVPANIVFVVQSIVAPVPHDQPGGALSDTNVVDAGSVSISSPESRSVAPAVTVIVYVRFDPAVTGSGAPAFDTNACCAKTSGVNRRIAMREKYRGTGS